MVGLATLVGLAGAVSEPVGLMVSTLNRESAVPRLPVRSLTSPVMTLSASGRRSAGGMVHSAPPAAAAHHDVRSTRAPAGPTHSLKVAVSMPCASAYSMDTCGVAVARICPGGGCTTRTNGAPVSTEKGLEAL